MTDMAGATARGRKFEWREPSRVIRGAAEVLPALVARRRIGMDRAPVSRQRRLQVRERVAEQAKWRRP